ncbi:MAG: threonine-phosphate decarboxylase [Planctomycetes bacterium]|nr:threonine-phosphate decarboxylase [Planctomycetota bacterium]
MTLIKVENLQYTYPDGTKALNGVNITVKKGEFLGILGPNGSGKTTLLKHLNGLLKPDIGCVAIDGRDLKSIPPAEIFSRVGMVFQDANDQLFALTVEQDVAFGPMNLKLSPEEVKSRVEMALKLVEMTAYARKPIHHLSHGQRKRVCIAGILAMNPDVLVLDEPTSDLDPAGVTSIMQLLKNLNAKRGITIIMATHDVDLVPVFMNHIAIMDSGRIVTEGKPEDIFAVPEIVTASKLELPQIAQLFTLLRQDVHIEDLPLTIGQARNLLVKMLPISFSPQPSAFSPQPSVDGHGGNITKICATYGLKPENILDFSASINPLGYSKSVQDAIRNVSDTILHYPDTDCAELKHIIAEKTCHRECEIIVGNGSTELIYLTPRTLHPRKALVFQPTFSDYINALQLVHTEASEIILNEKTSFQFSLDYAKLNGSPPALIFLCNPNNPTSQLTERVRILDLAEYFANATIVVDESFMNFVEEQESYSVLKDAGKIKNLVVICSLTKFFGMPGLRLGFLVAHETIVDRIKRFKEPWTVNAIAQLAGKAAMNDEDFIKRSRMFISAEKRFLYEQISRIEGLYPFYPSANFMLVRIDRPNLQVSNLYTQLIKSGLVIRDCSNFRGLDEQYFRIAVRTRDENLRLLNELKRRMKCA